MPEIENLRKIPSDLEAERSVLGGIFLKQDVFGDIIEILSPDDFYKNAHKIIYETMREIYNKGEVLDPLVVMNRLRKNEKFEEVGGEQIFYDIVEEVPTAANITAYAKIVKEKAILRRLGDVGTKIVEMTYSGYEEAESILDRAEGMIFKKSENSESKD